MQQKIVKLAYISLGLTACFLLFCFAVPTPRVDDALIGEGAYFLARQGVVKSNLLTGYLQLGFEHRLLIYHKLLVWQGAVAVKLAGWSIYTLHSVSLLYMGMFLCALGWFLKPYPRYYTVFSAAFCLAYHNFFAAAITFRPEMMGLTLGFICFVCLNLALKNLSLWHAVAGGVFAGLAALAHLNGLIYLIAGTALLLLHKRWMGAFFFTLTGVLTCVLYIIDLPANTDWNVLKQHFEQALTWQPPGINSWLWRIVDEQGRYLHSIYEVSLSVLLLFALAVAYPSLRKQQPVLLQFTALVAISLMLVSYNKNAHYLLYCLPYYVLIIVLGLLPLLSKASAHIQGVVGLMFTAYYTIMLVGDGRDAYLDWQATNTPSSYRSATQVMGTNTVILAPADYIYNEIEVQEKVLSLERFGEFGKDKRVSAPNFSALLDSARHYGVQGILLEGETLAYWQQKGLPNYSFKQAAYRVAQSTPDRLILVKVAQRPG